MRKIIALAVLAATTSAYSQSTTTSSTNVNAVKKKSFTEDLSYFYFSDLRNSTINEDVRGNKPNTGFYNMFNIRYTITEKDRVNAQIRFELTDKNDENGKGDRFAEDDARVTYQRLFYKTDQTSIRGTLGLQLPTSRGSQAQDDRILRLKPNIAISHTIDDYNSILAVPGYNRTLYTKGQAPVDETSRFYLSSWVMYTNSYLSEDNKLRLDLETSHGHMNGKADNNIQTTAFDVLAGVDMTILGASVFPYLVHNTMKVKAADQLGGGVQIFKSF